MWDFFPRQFEMNTDFSFFQLFSNMVVMNVLSLLRHSCTCTRNTKYLWNFYLRYDAKVLRSKDWNPIKCSGLHGPKQVKGYIGSYLIFSPVDLFALVHFYPVSTFNKFGNFVSLVLCLYVFILSVQSLVSNQKNKK